MEILPTPLYWSEGKNLRLKMQANKYSHDQIQAEINETIFFVILVNQPVEMDYSLL